MKQKGAEGISKFAGKNFKVKSLAQKLLYLEIFSEIVQFSFYQIQAQNLTYAQDRFFCNSKENLQQILHPTLLI